MGSWYWIGVSVGLGAAWGAFCGGGGLRFGMRLLIAVLTGGVVGGFVDLFASGGRIDVPVASVGALLAFLGTTQIVSGALRRGGTRGGIAILVAGAALVLAGIAFIPVAGYLEALALPALAARLRRTQPERYAGLRTLARD
ncbi:MAG: hypothetical protein ACRDLM_01375 [Gaiellaceae bacterium]